MDTVRSRQLNPYDVLFWKSRKYAGRPSNWKEILISWGYEFKATRKRKQELLLTSLQNNPNNIEYWKSRGWSQRPDDWYERVYGHSQDSGEDCNDEVDYSDDEGDYSDDEESEDEDQHLKSLQNNPNNIEFWRLQGYSYRPSNWRELLEDMGYYDSDDESDETSSEEEQASDYESESESDGEYEEHCQKSNVNNPNNDEYWQARGWSQRPEDWRDRIYENH